MKKSQLLAQQIYFLTKNEIWKTVGLTSFQKPTIATRFGPFSSLPIRAFSRISFGIHTFFNVFIFILKFIPIWWQFLLVEFW